MSAETLARLASRLGPAQVRAAAVAAVLRGAESDLSTAELDQIASLFHVSREIFTDSRAGASIEAELGLLKAVRDEELRIVPCRRRGPRRRELADDAVRRLTGLLRSLPEPVSHSGAAQH